MVYHIILRLPDEKGEMVKWWNGEMVKWFLLI